jgi:hypothetical protein
VLPTSPGISTSTVVAFVARIARLIGKIQYYKPFSSESGFFYAVKFLAFT